MLGMLFMGLLCERRNTAILQLAMWLVDICAKLKEIGKDRADDKNKGRFRKSRKEEQLLQEQLQQQQ